MTPDPIHAGLFARDEQGSPYLVGGRCARCARDHFPAQSTCPYCGAAGAEEVALPTTGRVWGWTAVLNPPPGYAGPVPFGFGVVELDGDGLRVITRLEAPDPAGLEFGERVRLVLVPLPRPDGGDPVETYSFEVA
jgi:uncharacterized OB-fold protein